MRLSDPRLTAARPVTIEVDGVSLSALDGETIAAAMAAAGRQVYRRTRSGKPRGLYCGMGTCFDCAVTVDGRMGQRACLTKVTDGMRVTTAMPAAEDLAALAPESTAQEVSVDCLVVGAGPAGLTLAATVAEAGASVLVVDERHEAGGQFFKPLAPSHRAADGALDRQFADGQALRERTESAGVMLWHGATVFAAFGPHEIAVMRAGQASIVHPRTVVLSPGAYERAVPVPGWTLPGVMTTGALQTLVRAYRVTPSDRIVIAGNGPLNLQLAVELTRAGVKPAAVIEAAPRPSLASLGTVGRMAAASPDLFGQGMRYLAKLRAAGVPVHWANTVVACEGNDAVTRVTFSDGHSRRTIDASVVALGYGFMPQTDLARLLGCAVDYDGRALGALAVATDADGRTSVPSVFAIGDGARIGGARVAQAVATVTASAVLESLGRAPISSGALARARNALERAQAFQAALWRLFEAPPIDTRTIADDTLVCRCEEVSAGAVRAACRDQDASATAVKRMTRAGMGRCQGRYCAATIARIVADEGGPTAHPQGFFAPRAPVRPVPLAALAAEQVEWGGHRVVPPPALSPRPERRNSFGTITTDVCVIGAGIAGTCVARELASRGMAVTVVDRQEPNAQASGANAGSLHVQLLCSDFGERAQAGGRPAAETLRIGPAAVELWREIERLAAQDLEIRATGGLMVAEDERELAFLRAKADLERRYGVTTEIIGANELRSLEPHLSTTLIGAAFCAQEGKINPLTATFAVRRLAREAGARFEAFAAVRAITHDAAGFAIDTEAGTVRARRIVNCAGGWASRISAMVGRPIPVQGAPLQMIVTEPGPKLVAHLIAHASRHLSLKQADAGGLIIGGGWPAALDEATGASRPERTSIAGNSWVACRVLPQAAAFHVLRVWAGMNINIDGAPIIGEMPGVPGFFNCVTSSGYTLAPAVARITADLIEHGRSDLPVEPYTLARF